VCTLNTTGTAMRTRRLATTRQVGTGSDKSVVHCWPKTRVAWWGSIRQTWAGWWNRRATQNRFNFIHLHGI